MHPSFLPEHPCIHKYLLSLLTVVGHKVGAPRGRAGAKYEGRIGLTRLRLHVRVVEEFVASCAGLLHGEKRLARQLMSSGKMQKQPSTEQH